MNLYVVNSNSSGNGYILQTDDKKHCLIIECGCHLQEYLKVIDYKLSTICSAIISHEHIDHAKYINEFHESGIQTYCTNGTLAGAMAKFGGNSFLNHDIAFGKWYDCGGNFWIKALKSQHDANEPCNFVLRHFEMGDLLFITDTASFPYYTNGVTNIMIESNFDLTTIDRLMPDKTQVLRLMQSHMSIQNAINVVKMQHQGKLLNVILIHLSKRNSDRDKFKQLMMQQINKNVIVAEKGLKVNLNSNIQF